VELAELAAAAMEIALAMLLMALLIQAAAAAVQVVGLTRQIKEAQAVLA
jgi:hypothetical protein